MTKNEQSNDKGFEFTNKPKDKHANSRWVTFFLILVVICFSIVCVVNVLKDQIVVYGQKNKPDSLQVFFPSNGSYSENNSLISPFYKNTLKGICIPLPRPFIHKVRIDPSNEEGNILITKIELRTICGTSILGPRELLSRISHQNMIDQFIIIPNGLLIKSSGNDPFFELQLNSSFVLLQYIILGIVFILLTVIVLLIIIYRSKLYTLIARFELYKLRIDTMRQVNLFVIPLLVSIFITVLFYPGFMSYDTLHALRSARNGVTDSIWPPMVSYIWRFVDMISPNPAAMHFTQIFLLLFSIFVLVYFFTKRIKYSVIFLIIYLIVPVVIGTIAVIWKDVLMAAFFLSGFAVTVFMKNVITRWEFILLSILALILIFLGVCTRHNAVIAALPLIVYLVFIICSKLMKTHGHIRIMIILFGVTLTYVIFNLKTTLDKYSLPSFVKIENKLDYHTLPGLIKMENNSDYFLHAVRVLDVAGASLCVGRNLFAEMSPNLTVSEIKHLYDPKHLNFSAGLLKKVGVDRRINKIWINVAIHHPICFFNYKFQLTKYLLGANKGNQFIVTTASIDKNEYGYKLQNSSFRDSVVNYINYASLLPFFRPWFIYLISIIAFIYLIRIRALSEGLLALFLSAVFYFGSLVLFGNAADARLPFFSTTSLLIIIFTSISEFKNSQTLKLLP